MNLGYVERLMQKHLCQQSCCMLVECMYGCTMPEEYSINNAVANTFEKLSMAG